MKATSLVRLSAVVLVVVVAATGCKKRPDRVTKIPGLGPTTIGDAKTGPIDPGGIAKDPNPVDSNSNPSGIALSGDTSLWTPAAEQPFRGDTIYFDFDKAVIKPSEVAKIERVSAAMKSYPGKGLRIEGHCDERGTEEYNRALGEKRALSVREKSVTSGMESRLVDTISYGEDRPANPAHDSAAWSKNRRAEFILIEPPRAASLK